MSKKTITKREEILVKKYYFNGLTGTEIAKKLNVTPKQVYGSLRRQNIPRKTMWEQNKVLFERKPPSFNFKKKLSVKDRELLIGGIMLYYGEGAKTGNIVDLANSDTKIAKLFIKFLRNICGINEKKLRFYLYCFSDQKVNSLINYWSSQLSVEPNQFSKPYIRSTFNKRKRIIPYGVIHIRYGDKKLLKKILSLCDQLIDEL
ncbi:MAG: hypothetical protein Q8O88_05555 [bacterium]|nr:hypothetical protein [bacterium]